MKRIFFLLLITTSLVSCDKNQKAVKRLDGEWTATKAISISSSLFSSSAVDLISQDIEIYFNFSNCKLKDDEFCEYSFTSVDKSTGIPVTQTQNGFYKVTNDGTTMITTDTIPNGTENIIDILELKKNNATLKQHFSSGASIEYTLIKI